MKSVWPIPAICVVGVILGLASCAPTPSQPKLQPPVNSALGIALTVQMPAKLPTRPANRVFFVKLDKEGDLYSPESVLIPSNYRKDNQFYLLYAQPARYVVVLAANFWDAPRYEPNRRTFSRPGYISTFTLYFPQDLIAVTEVDLEPGQFMFMGDYAVDADTRFASADEAQLYFYNVLGPGAKKSRLAAGTLRSGHSLTGSLATSNRSRDAETTFLTLAKAHLEGSGWSTMIDQRLEELSRP